MACLWYAGFCATIVTVPLLGFIGFMILGVKMTKDQKAILNDKYRKTIEAHAAQVAISKTDLNNLIKNKYKHVAEVW
jgi:hypothetical protein